MQVSTGKSSEYARSICRRELTIYVYTGEKANFNDYCNRGNVVKGIGNAKYFPKIYAKCVGVNYIKMIKWSKIKKCIKNVQKLKPYEDLHKHNDQKILRESERKIAKNHTDISGKEIIS